MKVRAVDPDRDTSPLLPGAQFADAFCVTVTAPALTARQAAERMMAHQPRWIAQLLALRDRLVAPFGLVTAARLANATADKIGFFPVISATPARLVAGLDDRHLDFRLVVDVEPCDKGQRVTATTLVLTHNWLGRIYLAVILPFHRLIARTLIRQVAG